MAKKATLNAPGDWVSMLEEIANQAQQPAPDSEQKEEEFEEEPSQPKTDEEVAKPAKKQVAKVEETSGDPLWDEFARLVDVYGDGKIGKNANKMAVDPEIAQTLRLIKGEGYSGFGNAILKAFILTYRTRLKKMIIAKPKSLL